MRSRLRNARNAGSDALAHMAPGWWGGGGGEGGAGSQGLCNSHLTLEHVKRNTATC